MVVAIIGVAEIIRDFGLTSAAVQAPTLSEGQRTNLFWINTAIGVGLTLAVCALAPLIASFYNDPRLISVTLVLSATFAIEGFAAQFRASLNREFRFAALTGIEVGAQVVAFVAALLLAAAGFGYWAIVAQQLLQAFVQALALPAIARWWPRLPRRHQEMRSLLSFGGGLVGGQLLVYLSRNVDSMVIGRVFGATWLGYYNRAFQLMLLPLNQIIAPSTRVALPTLSRLNDDTKRYAEFVLFGQTVLLNVVGFILGICAAQAHEIIPIVLGSQWLGSIPLPDPLRRGLLSSGGDRDVLDIPLEGPYEALLLVHGVDKTRHGGVHHPRSVLGRQGSRTCVPLHDGAPLADRHPLVARAH